MKRTEKTKEKDFNFLTKVRELLMGKHGQFPPSIFSAGGAT